MPTDLPERKPVDKTALAVGFVIALAMLGFAAGYLAAYVRFVCK